LRGGGVGSVRPESIWTTHWPTAYGAALVLSHEPALHLRMLMLVAAKLLAATWHSYGFGPDAVAAR
jgi:hypothetical protein